MKISAKIAILTVASAASFAAFAQTGGGTGGGTGGASGCAKASGSVDAKTSGQVYEYTAPTDSQCYMETDFKSPMSANVSLKWVQNTTAVAVQTSNSKGRNNYSGSSEGGRVAQCGEPTTGAAVPTTRAPDLTKPNGCTAS